MERGGQFQIPPHPSGLCAWGVGRGTLLGVATLPRGVAQHPRGCCQHLSPMFPARARKGRPHAPDYVYICAFASSYIGYFHTRVSSFERFGRFLKVGSVYLVKQGQKKAGFVPSSVIYYPKAGGIDPKTICTYTFRQKVFKLPSVFFLLS